jgi:hypothetical protein
MNDVDPQDAISESALRRALRLDADELAPRLEASAIVAAAGRRTLPERVLRLTRGFALVGVSLGIEAIVALAAFNWLSNIDGADLAGPAIAAFAELAERLAPLASLATDPSVATAALAAVVFGTIYERISGRESVRVQAS